MSFVIPGIIAGVVVFFALLGTLILFIEDLDIRIMLGIIMILIAASVGFFAFGGALFIGGCVTVSIIASLIANQVVDYFSVV